MEDKKNISIEDNIHDIIFDKLLNIENLKDISKEKIERLNSNLRYIPPERYFNCLLHYLFLFFYPFRTIPKP